MDAVVLIDVCRDGARMVSIKDCRMHALTDDETSRLIELIFDECGDALAFDEFASVIHGLFEDIPGIETMEADEANQLINSMWSKYHG